MNGGGNPSYRIERLTCDEELDALREEWNALLRAVPDAPVFLTWEWVSTWRRVAGQGWQLWILTARDAQNRLCGIVPLARYEQRFGPLRMHRLAFVGDNVVYRVHRDVLALAEQRRQVAAAVLVYLESHPRDWDVLELEGLVDGSCLAILLRDAAGHVHQFEDDLVRPYTALPESWETYEREQLGGTAAGQLRRRWRKLERDYPGQVMVQSVQNEDEFKVAFEALIMLHRNRWHGRGKPSGFDHPAYLAFYREILPIALQRGWLRLNCLWVGDRPIAAQFGFRYGDVLYAHTTTFDPEYGRYGPGQLVASVLVKNAIAEGVRTFDLGPGSGSYKFGWASSTHVDEHTVLSRSLVGHLWAYQGVAWRKAKGVYRRQVAPRLAGLTGTRREAVGVARPPEVAPGD